MNPSDVTKDPRVKWDGMRRWNLSRFGVRSPVVRPVDPSTHRVIDREGNGETNLKPVNHSEAALETSVVVGQGSGEGGRDGLRRPAPWSLAQGPGANSPQSPVSGARSCPLWAPSLERLGRRERRDHDRSPIGNSGSWWLDAGSEIRCNPRGTQKEEERNES